MSVVNWVRRRLLQRKLQIGVTKLSIDDNDQEDLRQILACYRQVESRFERMVNASIANLDRLNYSIFMDAYFIAGSERDYQYFLSVLHSIQLFLEEIKKEEGILEAFSQLLTNVLARRRKGRRLSNLERQTLDRQEELIKYFRRLGQELESLINLVISIGEVNIGDILWAGIIDKIWQNRELFGNQDREWINFRLKGQWGGGYKDIDIYALQFPRNRSDFDEIMGFSRNRIGAPLFENSRNVRTQLQLLKSRLEKLRDNFQFLKVTVHQLLGAS